MESNSFNTTSEQIGGKERTWVSLFVEIFESLISVQSIRRRSFLTAQHHHGFPNGAEYKADDAPS